MSREHTVVDASRFSFLPHLILSVFKVGMIAALFQAWKSGGVGYMCGTQGEVRLDGAGLRQVCPDCAGSEISPKGGVVEASGPHGSRLGVCADDLHHNGAIRAQDLRSRLHIHWQLLVAAEQQVSCQQGFWSLWLQAHKPSAKHAYSLHLDLPSANSPTSASCGFKNQHMSSRFCNAR